MNKKRAVVLIFIAFAVIAFLIWNSIKSNAVYIQEVSVCKVETEHVKFSQAFPGYFDLDESKVISARISGIVDKVFVDVGDTVKKGTILATFETKDYKIQMQKAEGELISSRASYNEALAKPKIEEIHQLEAQVIITQAVHAKLKSDLDKYQLLLSAGGISKSQIDELELSLKKSEQDLYINREKLSLASKGVDDNQQQVLAGQVQQTKAAYDLASNNLDNCVISTPINGIIVERSIDPGMGVSSGSTMFRLAHGQQLIFNAEVEENYLWAIQPSSQVKIACDGLRGKAITGIVNKISPQPVDSPIKTKNARYLVEISLPNGNDIVRSGMTGDLLLDIDIPSAIMVPSDAIIEKDNQDLVYIVEKGKCIGKRVDTGIRRDDRIEIVEGIMNGDNVILDQENINTGDIVRITNND